MKILEFIKRITKKRKSWTNRDQVDAREITVVSDDDEEVDSNVMPKTLHSTLNIETLIPVSQRSITQLRKLPTETVRKAVQLLHLAKNGNAMSLTDLRKLLLAHFNPPNKVTSPKKRRVPDRSISPFRDDLHLASRMLPQAANRPESRCAACSARRQRPNQPCTLMVFVET